MTETAHTSRYEVVHRTRYAYAEPVSLSFHQAMMAPRSLPHQRVESTELSVEPSLRSANRVTDYFGNDVTRFEINSPHRSMTVDARSLVHLSAPAPPELERSPTVEQALPQLTIEAEEYLCGSRHAPRLREAAAFARPSFPAGRPLLAGAGDLMRRIHGEFRYDPKVTTISTPVLEALANKHGVCQDFAHVMIASLRSLGVAARYVSGYLTPLPGVVGASASHAWVSVFCPLSGWVDFDPTNDVIVSDGHITVAWGRDYADVSPLRGVVYGGGRHTLDVEVEIAPLA